MTVVCVLPRIFCVGDCKTFAFGEDMASKGSANSHCERSRPNPTARKGDRKRVRGQRKELQRWITIVLFLC